MADEEKTTAQEKPKSSSALKPILVIGIGCVVLLFVAGAALTVAGGFLAKKLGMSFLSSFIEKNTGIKTNLGDAEKGKLTFTDKESGTTVDVGTGKLPEGFPKDFPLYPGAKVAGSLTGGETGKTNGFWVTFTTQDAFDKVTPWYKTNLTSSGWTIKSTLEMGEVTTWSVAKDTNEGTLTVTGSKDKEKKETTIVVMLGEAQKKTPVPTQEEESPPVETAAPEESPTEEGSL